MKKIILVIIFTLTLFNSCVYDKVVCMSITNRTNDTIFICYADYNNIDSIKGCIGTSDFYPLKLNEEGKVILYGESKFYNKVYGEFHSSSDIIFPDSCARYCQPGFGVDDFFSYNKEKKGDFLLLN